MSCLGTQIGWPLTLLLAISCSRSDGPEYADRKQMTNSPSRGTTFTSMADDGDRSLADADLILNSVMFAEPLDYSGDDREFPVAATIRFAPTTHLFCLIEGVLYSTRTAGQYADVVNQWQGFKCSTFPAVNNNGWGPHARTQVTAPAIAFELVFADGTTTTEAIPEPGSVTHGVVNCVAYSFMQNRALLEFAAPRDLRGITIVVPEALREYRGFLRVHLFQGGGATDIIFEEYGKDPNFAPSIKNTVHVGAPAALESPPGCPFVGDCLCPIGLSPQCLMKHNGRTCRVLDGVRPGEPLRLEVSGIFGFSNYCLDSKDLGGGGGLQDAQYRFDHIRPGFPPLYPAYALRPDTGQLLFDAELKIFAFSNDGKGEELPYSVITPNGNKDPHELQRARNYWYSASHTYEIEVRVPSSCTGRLLFYIKDGGAIKKTWDNCGCLLISRIDAGSRR